MKNILITGGAGFVGANLAIYLAKHLENIEITCLDNLKRRGSELNLSRLRAHRIKFIHGDIRNFEDLTAVGAIDIIIECSAEPSVLAGYEESPLYLINTNFTGTVNCLELARIKKADFIFLSTSRVYPLRTINQLKYIEKETRFELAQNQKIHGVSPHGFTEKFPLEGTRSLYGTTKLCSEYLVQEYSRMYGIRSVINRCGLITGAWQMGKSDQGVVVFWIARHIFGGPLAYVGFGGKGKQVRDILHIDDLCELLIRQIKTLDTHNGQIYNVGGGKKLSISLQELTKICQEVIGKQIQIGSVATDRQADIPYYVTDITKIKKAAGWTPQKSIHSTIQDIADWIYAEKQNLQEILT